MANRRGLRMRERTIHLIGGLTADDVERRISDAIKAASSRGYLSGFREGTDYSGNDEPPYTGPDGQPLALGYRSTRAAPRDLSSISQERAIQAAYRLWNTNPLAKALTEIIVDYVVGDGATLAVEDPEVEKALDAFWFDPVNDMDGEGTETLVRELGMFGEVLRLAVVRDGSDQGIKADGRLRLAPVDPSQIEAVITAPGNRRHVLAVQIKPEGTESTGLIYALVKSDGLQKPMRGRRDYEAYARLTENLGRLNGRPDHRALASLVSRCDQTVSGQAWRFREQASGSAVIEKGELLAGVPLAGDCFLFQINKVSTGTRGRPDLLPMIDWLDRYDELFFDAAEHVAMLSKFVWDLQIKGGSETAPELESNLQHQAKKLENAPPNSVYAHNENTTLEAKNPTLRTAEIETIVRQLRVFIAGGMRVPEHWVAEGGYTNRATAAEMGEPTYRMLRRRQAFVEDALTQMCQYQIDILVALGLLPQEVPVTDEAGEQQTVDGQPVTQAAREAFSITLPEMTVKDVTAAATALDNVVSAVYKAHLAGILPLRPALELLAAVAKTLGVEIDVEKALEADQESQADKQARADFAAALAGRGNGRKPPGTKPESDDEEPVEDEEDEEPEEEEA